MGVDVIAKLSQKNNADFPIVNDTDVFNGFRVVGTFASFASLKASTAGNGAMAYVTSNNSFYQFNGTTWVVTSRQPRPEYAVSGSAFQIFVRTTGDDENNDGKSSGSPYATIDRALQDIPLKYTSFFMIDVGAGTFAWVNRDYAFENAGFGSGATTGISIVGATNPIAVTTGGYTGGALVSGTVSTFRYTVPSYAGTLTLGSHFAGLDFTSGSIPFALRDATAIVSTSTTSTSLDIPSTFDLMSSTTQSYISAYQTFIMGNPTANPTTSASSFEFILPPTVRFVAITFKARDLHITSKVLAGQITAFGGGSAARITPPTLAGCHLQRANSSMVSNVILSRSSASSGFFIGNCEFVSGFFSTLTIVGVVNSLTATVFSNTSTAFSSLFVGQGDANQTPPAIGNVRQLGLIDFATGVSNSFGCIEVTGPGSNVFVNDNMTVGSNYVRFLTIGGGGRIDWKQVVGFAAKTVTGTVFNGIEASLDSFGSTGSTLSAGGGSAYVKGAKLALNGTLTCTGNQVRFGRVPTTVNFSALPQNDLAAADPQLIVIN